MLRASRWVVEGGGGASDAFRAMEGACGKAAVRALAWVRRCFVPKSKVATRLDLNLPSPPLTLFAGANKQGDAGGDQGAEAFRAIEGVGSRRAGRVGAPWSAGGMSKSKVATRLDLTV